MIRTLLDILGPAERRTLTRLLAWISAASVLQGLAFVMLVPVLRALFGSHPTQSWPYLGALLGISAIWAVVNYIGLRRGMESGASLSRDLRHRIGDHIATLPLGWFGPERLGSLSALTSETVMSVARAPAHLLRPLVAGFVTPATVVAAMYVFDWRLALATTLSIPVIVAVYRWSSRLTAQADRLRGAAVAEAGGRVIEFARAQPVLRAFGRSDRQYRVLDEALVVQRDASRDVLLAMVPGLIGFTLVIQGAFVALVVYGTYLALGARLAASSLVALLALMVRFIEPMSEAAALGSVLTGSANAATRVQDVLHVAALPEPRDPQHPRGAAIEFDNVTFSYNGKAAPPLLENISFSIPEHSMTALIGPSGSGKTTITRLIARFFDVDAGAVRIGGVDVRSMSTEVLMSQIATVFQDVTLFSGSIADNIRIGRPAASEDEVYQAARLARVDEIIERLPDSWDTQVGESGARLSGGERQRISIARAILKDAPIVLLDEFTAALDSDNAYAVHAALAELAVGRTLVVVTHRLQTVTAADQILVLGDGTIAERGTHDELIEIGGHYAEFWSKRRRAAAWHLTENTPPKTL